jgi:hypothetical protein
VNIFDIYSFVVQLSIWKINLLENGMGRGTSLKNERWDALEEVPHRNRMGFLPCVELGRIDCGKRKRGELLVLDCVMKDCALPQAVILRWESNIAVLLEVVFIFFLSLHHFAMHFCLAI